MNAAILKNAPHLTRADIAALLKSIGKPGEKREQKLAAVASLEKKNAPNLGGHALELTLESYTEY
jgi:hypothetical protein